LKINLDNVSLNSNSRPNSFAKKLVKYADLNGHSLGSFEDPDAHLCFIESRRQSFDEPMFQRLDGIYFNTSQDYNAQNSNIKRTYNIAAGVIFQSHFNQQLITKFFGEHPNHTVIHNGADLDKIVKTPPLAFDRYENLWSCASSWRPHKRLGENIKYFLEHSGPNDGLMVAGSVDVRDRLRHKRVHYVGHLNQKQLFALYKRSKYFIHLAWLDHCPNVVVDARACGATIICSSAGGTKEIAGLEAIVIEEPEWDMSPTNLYTPPPLDFSKKSKNNFDNPYCMKLVANKYIDFMKKSKTENGENQ